MIDRDVYHRLFIDLAALVEYNSGYLTEQLFVVIFMLPFICFPKNDTRGMHVGRTALPTKSTAK
jgi:hypothetical protein